VNVELSQIARATHEVRELVGALESELARFYTAEQRHGLSIERIFQPHILFFVARLDGTPVGCGGVAFEDGFAEVKRMYVRPSARGQGVARAILARLESEARARSYNRLTLETGDLQREAIRLYERAGFTRCEPFGDYMRLPAAAIIRSVFFEKRMT
jgi:putative acetyltransferase